MIKRYVYTKPPEADYDIWVLYYGQRFAAKRRGIPWEFTFDSWVAWWVKNAGPDWTKKRGRTKDNLCMARKGDKGSYSPDNVDCITVSANFRAVATNGLSAKKLNKRDVRAIYVSTLSGRVLAKKYGVHESAIGQIKRGEVWKHITQELGKPHINPVGGPSGKHNGAYGRTWNCHPKR